MFKDSLFKRIEQKTNIKKETILELANKLQKNDMKDEKALREIIQEISTMTGKEVSKEKEDRLPTMMSTLIRFISWVIQPEATACGGWLHAWPTIGRQQA